MVPAVLVFDGPSGRLTRLSPEGQVLETLPVPSPDEGSSIYIGHRAEPVADGGVLVQWEVAMPSRPSDPYWHGESPVLARLDEAGSLVPMLRLEEVTSSEFHFQMNMAHGVAWCTSSDGEVAVVGSRTAPQLAALEAAGEGEPLFDLRFEDGLGTPYVAESDGWRRNARTSIGCLEDWIVYRMVHLDRENYPPAVEWWVGYDGRLGWSTEILPGTPRDRVDHIQAGAGETLVTTTNTEGDWPVAFVWTVEGAG